MVDWQYNFKLQNTLHIVAEWRKGLQEYKYKLVCAGDGFKFLYFPVLICKASSNSI